MDNGLLITLTSDIVAAHVSNNSVTVDDLSEMIPAVYKALAHTGNDPATDTAAPTPAVPVRASVKPHAVTCLECGFQGVVLKRHLATHHDLTPADYRARWNLPTSHPLVAPNYAAHRAQLARTIGLGRKRPQKAVAKGRRKKLKPAIAR